MHALLQIYINGKEFHIDYIGGHCGGRGDDEDGGRLDEKMNIIINGLIGSSVYAL